MSLDAWFKRAFGDDEHTAPGTGWVSGVIGVLAGFLALGGVLCFRWPELLTSPVTRERWPIPPLRVALQVLLAVAFVAGARSTWARRRKVLGPTALALALLASLLGGASVPLPGEVGAGAGLGLDWFLVNLLLMALVFVPLERVRPRLREQLVFRPGWTTDGGHFFASHLLVGALSFVAVLPARALGDGLVPAAVTGAMSGLPLGAQVVAAIVLADTVQYLVHRAFHRVPALWRLHAVHHSSPALDWLAGSRMHLLEAFVTRTLVLTPLLLIGLAPPAIAGYLLFVSFHAVFIHANFGVSLRWLEPFLVTPRYHHFHHADEAEAIDRNFAVHLPVLDRLFGTRFLPADRWPRGYGVAGPPLPDGWLAQLGYPFGRGRRR